MKNYGFLLSTLTHIKLRRLFTNWLPQAWHLKYISQWSSSYLYKHDLNKDIQVLTDKSISSYELKIITYGQKCNREHCFPQDFKSSNVYFTCLSGTPTLIILMMNHQHLPCKNLVYRTFDSFPCWGGQRYFSTNPNEQEFRMKLTVKLLLS